MIKRYCKVEVNNDYIYATFFLGRKKKIKWNNVKSIQKTNLLLLNLEMGEIYKVKTKFKETILFSTGNSCNLEKILKLDEFIDSKNDKLILPK